MYASPGELWARPAGIFPAKQSRPHTIKMKLDYFRIHFEDWVAMECGLSWPLYSPTVSQCDYFLWVLCKSHTIEELKNNITDNMQVMTVKVSAVLHNSTVKFQMVVQE
jgi:hypothetical protein